MVRKELSLVALFLLAQACGQSPSPPESDGGAADAGGVDAGFGDAGSPDAGAGAFDPTMAGAYSSAKLSGSAAVVATGHQVPVDCEVPTTGPSPAPYPLVLILHGFQLSATQYQGYAERLASHGYVACLVDYPAGFVPNHVEAVRDVRGALDWLLARSQAAGDSLLGKIDPQRVGVMGHSLGGKLSVLAASDDARFGAVLGLDPVDGASFCNATDCPDAIERLPLPIPTAFLGETLDATANWGGQACAPSGSNYQTFYAAAATPSLEVTLVGASHMSFIDEPASCGLFCGACQTATLSQARALFIARAYSAAFFERWLRQRTEAEAWLTGAQAQAAFVAPGDVSLFSK